MKNTIGVICIVLLFAFACIEELRISKIRQAAARDLNGCLGQQAQIIRDFLPGAGK